MYRVIEFAKHRAADFVLGGAGCLIGIWLAQLPSALCTWALRHASGAELAEGRFRTVVALPPDSPWAMHALQEFGPLTLFVGAFLAAVWLAWRLSEAASLAVTCVAFWLALPICTELVRYGWSPQGTLELLAQTIGVPPGGQFGQQALAVVCGLGIAALLRSGLRRSALNPLSAFAAPACLLLFLPDVVRVDFRALDRTGFGDLPAVLAVVVALATLLPTRRDWRQPKLQNVGLLAALGLAAAAAPIPLPQQDQTIDWTEVSSDGWTIRFEADHFEPEDQRRWIELADKRLISIRERLGVPSGGDRIWVHVATSAAAVASRGNVRWSSESFALDAPGGPVLMASQDLLPEDPRGEPLLAMRQAWGRPGSDTMALALARYAVGSHEGETLAAAASRVACEESRYSPEAVFAVDAEFHSPLGRDAVAGGWVENAVARHGTAALAKLYRQDLKESLTLCPGCVPACGADTAGTASREITPQYLKGISFSHEGRVGGGYGSAAARRELQRIQEIGANSVALVPYAFTAAPEETSIRFRTLETDARLVRAARQADALGLAVMLKPHLWAGQRFHGEISFRDKARFDDWFGDYRRWMLHYARFAEANEIELLAIGNELAGLTVDEQAWRSLIADVRRVYRGRVTYAAHWQAEVERIGFWDALDYIGVNFYFPIAAEGELPTAESPELRQAARTVERVQTRFDKPVLFTEVGFPALATAASRPWEENSSALDVDLQARSYEVWLERFAREPYVSGMFWWKWPSHGRASPFDTSHRPLAKPALQILRDWFGRL